MKKFARFLGSETINLQDKVSTRRHAAKNVGKLTCSKTPWALSSTAMGGSAKPTLSATACPIGVFTHLTALHVRNEI